MNSRAEIKGEIKMEFKKHLQVSLTGYLKMKPGKRLIETTQGSYFQQEKVETTNICTLRP